MELSGFAMGLLGCGGPRGTRANEMSASGVSKSSPLRRSIFGPLVVEATTLPSLVSLQRSSKKKLEGKMPINVYVTKPSTNLYNTHNTTKN